MRMPPHHNLFNLAIKVKKCLIAAPASSNEAVYERIAGMLYMLGMKFLNRRKHHRVVLERLSAETQYSGRMFNWNITRP